MRRLTSVFALLPAVALIAIPALAQTTPPPSPAIVMPVPPTPSPGDVMAPSMQRGAPGSTRPTPAPGQRPQGQPGQQGQQGQPGQGQQPTTQPPQAVTPRPDPNAPNLGGPNNPRMPSHTNVRLDLTITDTFTGSPVKKTVSLLVLTNFGGMIRTTSADGWAVLNVDAVAAAYTNGLVSIRLTFEYTPALTKEVTNRENITGGRPPRLNESITVVLQDGKPMMVSQSADPATDRKVTAELTATILK